MNNECLKELNKKINELSREELILRNKYLKQLASGEWTYDWLFIYR